LLRTLTRQFLPGYFQARLAALGAILHAENDAPGPGGLSLRFLGSAYKS